MNIWQGEELMTEQQYLERKAKLIDKWFNEKSYTDNMYRADLKVLESSWLENGNTHKQN
tara:strand:- start:349 stop:525 length:177 start_codon:yes stop_codon:yes gene_type:complete